MRLFSVHNFKSGSSVYWFPLILVLNDIIIYCLLLLTLIYHPNLKCEIRSLLSLLTFRISVKLRGKFIERLRVFPFSVNPRRFSSIAGQERIIFMVYAYMGLLISLLHPFTCFLRSGIVEVFWMSMGWCI